MTKYLNAKNGIEILHKDGQTQLLAGAGDPSEIGVSAETGSLFLRNDSAGGVYQKTGNGDKDWDLLMPSYSPTLFSGSEGSFLAVDSTASGIEFIDVIDGGSFL